MNYRHHFHAGNFADVFKHVALIQLARALQRKPGGILFLDTHAGWGGYDLRASAQGDTRPRPPEFPDGIGRLWTARDLEPALLEYVGWVQAYQAERSGPGAPALGPIFYPGSPWFLRRVAREQDRLALYEIDPEAVEALRIQFGAARRTTIQAGDGYGALAAMLPPPERRALVLVDPPYEAEDEWERADAALRTGLRRLPHGLFVQWYPLTARAGSEAFLDHWAASDSPPSLAVEIMVDATARMRGCGLLIVNPPWRFETEASPALQQLTKLLERNAGATLRWRWLVSEKDAKP